MFGRWNVARSSARSGIGGARDGPPTVGSPARYKGNVTLLANTYVRGADTGGYYSPLIYVLYLIESKAQEAHS